ncbi:phage tail protein [Undibacterium umbellatum]|uniref:Phage tail protein n=1 Tax=Undibacterium umbellatum TaxID=2762300 RepID=A0ABR6ZIP1_9BURK|nr:phage tail protein [Undibacterium umbellatum]MBC3911607.1 phage tail protein [Undibacterium umbellatum]
MYKPNSLRAHLTAAIPDLQRNPDKLLVFADKGSLHTTRTASRSFEYAYVLNIIVTDYSGEEDALIVPLLDWLATHQADLLGNDDKAKGIRFMVDFNNHNSVDISLEIDLTERVIVKQTGTRLDITHAGEITPTPDYTAPWWQLYNGTTLLAEWQVQPTPPK